MTKTAPCDVKAIPPASPSRVGFLGSSEQCGSPCGYVFPLVPAVCNLTGRAVGGVGREFKVPPCPDAQTQSFCIPALSLL